MSRPFSPFEPKDLKDCASSEAVERVWSRLEEEIGVPVTAAKRPSRLIWGVAALGAAFAAGVWVGDGGQPESARTIPLYAEHPAGVAAPASLQPPNLARPGELQSIAERGASGPPRRAVSPGDQLRELSDVVNEPDVSALSSAAIDPVQVPQLEREVNPYWQRLANGGEYEAALFELGQQGGFESALSVASAEQLMLLVDVARATGQRQRALAALRRVVTQFPGEPVAPLAAWSLANLLEKAGDAAGAAEAFAAYTSLSPQGDFAEDALVRQLQSAVNRADRDRAMRLLAQYESEFPEARRAKEVSRLRGRLLNVEPGSADAGAPEAAEPQDSTSSPASNGSNPTKSAE